MVDIAPDVLRELITDAVRRGVEQALATVHPKQRGQWLTPTEAGRIYRRRSADVLRLIEGNCLRAQRVKSRGPTGLGWRIDPEDAQRVLGAPNQLTAVG